jgi:hypothetical protein
MRSLVAISEIVCAMMSALKAIVRFVIPFGRILDSLLRDCQFPSPPIECRHEICFSSTKKGKEVTSISLSASTKVR